MTNNARPRHAVQSRASKIAGRTALGVLGAPVAMLAVAGPAGAATLDMGGTYDDGALDLNLAADGLAAPGLDALGVPALPSELPSELPIDGAAFEGVNLDLFDLGGQDDIALPGLPALPSVPSTDDVALPSADALPLAGALAAVPVALPELPSVDSLPSLPSVSDVALPELPALPGTDSLPSLPGTDSLPSLPSVSDVALPELPALPGTDSLPSLPGTDSLPSLPSLPSASDAVDTATGLAGGLPTSAQLDLEDVSSTVTDAAPAAADVFSATDLVQGLI